MNPSASQFNGPGFVVPTQDGGQVKAAIGRDARRAAREQGQAGGRVLPGTRLNPVDTTQSVNRPEGAEVLLNLGRTPKAETEAARVVGVEGPRLRTTRQVAPQEEETPIYLDLADARVQANSHWARSKNPNDLNMYEVENDAWEMTNKQNPLSDVEGKSRRHRTDLGDVLRTISKGRLKDSQGAGLTANPTKGWHPRNAGPSRVKPSQWDRPDVKYTPELEAERS